ncbi:4Fe-4S binding protein [bacterium]|nr:4Fe-4S binding protein [bacterium]
MQVSKRVILTFPASLAGTPVTYRLVKDYNLVMNILRAKVIPKDEGRLVLELSGEKKDIEAGLIFLKEKGVSIEALAKDIHLDEESCVHCGFCTAVCFQDALSMNPETWKLEFNREKCVLCEQCVDICPMGAIQIKF